MGRSGQNCLTLVCKLNALTKKTIRGDEVFETKPGAGDVAHLVECLPSSVPGVLDLSPNTSYTS